MCFLWFKQVYIYTNWQIYFVNWQNNVGVLNNTRYRYFYTKQQVFVSTNKIEHVSALYIGQQVLVFTHNSTTLSFYTVTHVWGIHVWGAHGHLFGVVWAWVDMIWHRKPEIHTWNPHMYQSTHIGLPVCSSSSRVLFVLPLAKFCRLEEHAGDWWCEHFLG